MTLDKSRFPQGPGAQIAGSVPRELGRYRRHPKVLALECDPQGLRLNHLRISAATFQGARTDPDNCHL
jgi:hypothetical protein